MGVVRLLDQIAYLTTGQIINMQFQHELMMAMHMRKIIAQHFRHVQWEENIFACHCTIPFRQCGMTDKKKMA